jgi:hypothetical protein
MGLGIAATSRHGAALDHATRARRTCSWIAGSRTTLADLVAAGLELRLDQRHDRRGRRHHPEHGRQRQAQRDERDVDRGQVGRLRQGFEPAHVGALHDHHARVAAQSVVELAVAHVERVHPARAALEQDVGEAAGRGAHVQGDGARDVQPPGVERRRQLEPAAADVGQRRPQHGDAGVVGDGLAGLGGRPPVDLDRPGQDERLRPLPRLRQPALDQGQV